MPHTTSAISRRALLQGLAAVAAGSLIGRPVLAQNAAITIGVGSDPVFAPFFVAAHEKMFAAQGVNVEVKPFTDGGTALDALIAQQVTLGVASEPTHLVRLGRGADLRPLAVVQESGRYTKLVARKGLQASQIKKFGYVPGSLSEYVTSLLIKNLNLDPATLAVKSGPPELPALLARGDIDAYFAWEPWPSIGVRQGGEVLMTSEDKAVGYTSQLWLTSLGSWADANKAAAQTILQTLKQAAAIALKDPQRAAVATQAIIKMPSSQSLPLIKDLDEVVRDFNDQDVKTTLAISAFLVEKKAVPALQDPARFLQRGFFKG
jgi:NitT/TauT family transport system substrate-binding protein